MRFSLKSILAAGMLLTTSLAFTSCDGAFDDVFGEWDKPAGNASNGDSTPSGSSTISVTGIKLNESLKVLVKDGDVLTITATVTPSDATDKTVTWTSDDPAVATVDNGVVTPVGLGITTITAKSGNQKATCEVFVGKIVSLGTKTADYNAENYDILTGTLNSYYSIKITDGYHVAFNGLTTSKAILCPGDATIYLADGKTNDVNADDNAPGIWIGVADKTLTINAETLGTGILNATGGTNGGSGIGTTGVEAIGNSVCGNITINGGKITATGGTGGGAGIGTGMVNNGFTNKCGKITINGGEVIATGKGSAAGIGTGYAQGSNNQCGDITINGGTVTATGNGYAAGIGTGNADSDNSTAVQKCGDITINGGTINATGGTYGAGIGTGYSYKPLMGTADQKCGAISIAAGVKSVTATKGSSSTNSIGIGESNGGTQACGVITFDTAPVFGATAQTYGGNDTWVTMADGNTYGGLKLAISTKTNTNDTWTLTPVAP